MNKKLRFFLCASLIASSFLSAQDRKTEKARKDFDNHSYASAIENYEDLVKKGYSNEEIFKNLGDSNYQNAQYTEAANWYGKLFKIESNALEVDYMYRYAQSLKSSKEYKASAIWMKKFEDAKTQDARIAKKPTNADYLEEIEKNSGRYTIKNIATNSKSSDFSPAFKDDQLVFSTARDTGTVTRVIHQWNNQPFTNLYVTSLDANGEYSNSSKLSSLNKKTHESSAAFTKDGTTVYFTRNNSTNGNFNRDEEGVSRLKIFQANLKNGKWTNIKELPFNGADFSTAHPALNPDETKLYFASDMEGTHGESDIFVVDIHQDGSFGTPQNLGNTINTQARETFPFITESNVLYFASDGHPGLGGLDVFATKLDDLSNLKIVNTGKPINSEQDDFSFIIKEETKTGFFTSNRKGGKGSDDIYSFTENIAIELDCKTLITGIIRDKADGSVLPGAQITLTNNKGEELAEVISQSDGSFQLDGDCSEGEFKLTGENKGYNSADTKFTAVMEQDNLNQEILLTKQLPKAPLGTDLAKLLSLKPIHFDLDKSFIRPDAAKILSEVVNYLNEYPKIKINVQSHTDVKASAAYNIALSNRRAKSTIAYLVANGIDEQRLTGEGFGETKLINDCTTLEKCTDKKHEENRRSEFIVIE